MPRHTSAVSTSMSTRVEATSMPVKYLVNEELKEALAAVNVCRHRKSSYHSERERSMPFFQSLVIWDRSAESRIIIRHGCFSNVEKKLSDDASLCFCQGELQNFRKFGALQVSSALFSEQFGDFSVMQPRRQGVSLAMRCISAYEIFSDYN
jgi:hypothetical protein